MEKTLLVKVKGHAVHCGIGQRSQWEMSKNPFPVNLISIIMRGVANLHK